MEIVIGIDIGGTNTVFGLVDKNGNCLSEGTIRTDKFENVKDFIKELSDEINILISELNNDYDIRGIGIGAPNGNYFKGTVEFAPNLKWEGVINFSELFKEHFDLPVILTNDANAAAFGEMVFGAAKGMKDFIIITLGTGLGSGFVSNGELIYGHDGFAGELGHTIVFHDGRLCGCGRKGCLEQYASATGIVNTVLEMLESTTEDSILKNYKPEEVTSKLIYEAAHQGDLVAMEAFDFTGRVLGFAIANAVALTSPEAIILFGGLALAGDFIFKPTKMYMEYYMMEVFKNKVKLLPSQIVGKNAAVLGASAIVWKNLE
ncbi:MAG: ROK family protein [Ignavibacteria bacterium]|jgi:glucokinase